MKSHKHYIKKEQKGQIIFIALILLAIAVGLLWNAIEESNQPPAWQTSYPMANANISWEQTHHPGPLGWVEDGN